MYIKELLWRNRNDFGFICACEHCGHSFRRGDGYADAYFQQVVVPGQHCPECRTNSHGDKADQSLADPASAINDIRDDLREIMEG